MIASVVGLATYGDAPSGAVRVHLLLSGVQTGPLALVADAAVIVAVIWYLLAVRRLAVRCRRWSPGSTVSFLAGVAVVWIAVGSGLAAYDEVNVTLHVVQHLLLMMVAPPLIAIGRPVTLASQAASRRTQVVLLRVVHSRAVAVVTFPVLTWFLYFGTMYAYFQDRGLYDYSIEHKLFHDATHLIFLVIGYLYWQPIVGGDPTRWRLPIPARAGSVFLGMPFEAFLGISISQDAVPIDPINSLANTHAGGETFWAGAMFVTALWLAFLGGRWFRELGREPRREDVRVQTQAAAARARAEKLGVQGLRDGWTVPWWRLQQIEAERDRIGREDHLGRQPDSSEQ